MRILHGLSLVFRKDRSKAYLHRLSELDVLAAIHPNPVLSANENELLDSLREIID